MMPTTRLLLGDCLEVMATMEANSVDAIICDPPYALTNRVPDEVRCSGCGWVPGGSFGNGKPGEACTKCGAALTRTRAYKGAGFMGKEWDNGRVAFEPEIWAEALRVAKPGAHLLAFGGDRTHHRLMVAIEDAGWELRTCLYWIFGSGFPKSMAVDKAIEKKIIEAIEAQGHEFTGWADE